MRKCASFIICSLFLALIGITPCLASQSVALVIGNSDYNSIPLRNPVNDASDMASMLENLGFVVILKSNADQQAMDEAMAAFYKKLQHAKVGLFYYAGHGMQIDGINYLLPARTTIQNPSDVKYRAIDSRRILGILEDAGTKLNIVILDACRNNPFNNYFRSQKQGLAFMDAPDGTIIAHATAPGSVAADGMGRNGVYTGHLLKNLQRPDLSVLEMFNRTALEVKDATSNKQSPWISTSAMEAYFLAGGKPADRTSSLPNVAEAPVQPQISPGEIPGNILQSGTLRVGLDPGYKPFGFRNNDGVVVGFDIDLAKLIAEEMNVRLELVTTAWQGIIPKLVSGRYDILMSGMTITEK